MADYKIRSKRTREAASNRIASTLAAKNFGRLVNRVREVGATYVIERGGMPVAQIGPVESRVTTIADFKALIRHLPPADEEYLRAVEDGVTRHNVPRARRNPWGR